LLLLVQLQERMTEQDVHKRRLLAGIVKSSEKLKTVVPSVEPKPAPAKKPRQWRGFYWAA